ncbi:MAG TPA: hypothetical protein VLT86_09710 [Vicinamibacterales bacterium]|nr:hypothetical protein [Vicinamibacterales bacterium]
MSIDVEYAIKKDIRNNQVVREVDAQQKRDFRRTVLLALLIVGTALVSAWQHVEVVKYGRRAQKVRDLLSQEESLRRKLRVDYEMERAPQNVQQRAVHELHMVAPSASDIIVIERAPAVAPRKDIVADAR